MDTMLVKHHSTNHFFYLRLFLLQIVLLCLVACNLQSNNDAPVSNGWEDTSHTESTYRVGHGETLYSIAWRYGLDFRQLVAINHFPPPYHIHEGQIIKVVPDNFEDSSSTYVSVVTTTETTTPPTMVYNNNAYKPTITAVPTALPIGPQQQNKALNNTIANGPTTVTTTSTATLATDQSSTPIINMDYTNGPVSSWLWPVRGKVIDNYTGSTGFNKGIDIAGYKGEPIHATAPGRIVYCGNGLRGYGQLIIIKHNDEYLSAYAHNSKLLVKEGQIVKGGQVIALMGDTEAQRVMLHFEIRRAGKPVDPLTYLSHA